MSDHITPEEARELLRFAVDGPWTIVEYGGSRPVAMIETFDGDTLALEVEPDDAPLIVAAPALAELVAGLHYEYAVELKHGDWWNTSRHRASTIEAAKEIAARYTRTETRIVRRLVSAPEVVE